MEESSSMFGKNYATIHHHFQTRLSPVCGPHLADELYDELHHQLGLLVEHALPQLVHHALGEVEDVVDQRLVVAPGGDGHGGVLSCR